MVAIPLKSALPPLELEVKVRFWSEFHIGTGHAIPGVVDDCIVRDGKERLVIPGTTLKGVIRDACETVARLMNIQHCDGTWGQGARLCGINFPPEDGAACYICNLFGNRGHEAKLRFGPGRYDPKLEKLLVDDRLPSAVRDRLARAEWHNRIDRELGRAQEDFLFSYELGLKTWEFTASILEVSPIPADQRRRHLILLLAGIRFVRELGGKRRAGKGQCCLEPELKLETDETVDALIGRLKELRT
jgi:CRISPR/Cas system CSM-associated protein Csm3 (group 7 of RAMP superfamily)